MRVVAELLILKLLKFKVLPTPLTVIAIFPAIVFVAAPPKVIPEDDPLQVKAELADSETAPVPIFRLLEPANVKPLDMVNALLVVSVSGAPLVLSIVPSKVMAAVPNAPA